MEITESYFLKIAKGFDLSGNIESIKLISNGNINSTFDVEINTNGRIQRYVFQKMNVFVFKNPDQIMDNIDRITSHIKKKIIAEGADPDGVMHFLHAQDGKNYHIFNDEFWRVSEYVKNSVTYNESSDLDLLRSAGYAFGHFQVMLSDFDASSLYETIKDFHNTRRRYETFISHVNEDPCGRVSEVWYEIEQIKNFAPQALRLCDMLDEGKLPLRVTHNDTKINNVLFDANTNQAKTVIDLDTVMPGLVAHDFGDAIRFAASTAAEDEPDISKISLDMDKFCAFAEGFVNELAPFITEEEINTLALGAFVMTAELVIRFLDDYITGDKYFKTLYEGHNLVRTRAQLALALDMNKKLDQMTAAIQKIAKK